LLNRNETKRTAFGAAWAVVAGVASAGVLALAGCGEHHEKVVVVREVPPQPVVVERRPAEVIVVQEAPPPLMVERIPPPPSPMYVWIGGHYEWHNGYHWVSGHHVLRPHERAEWVADTWVHTEHGYRYAPGHWR
jgi:hypothetical protein